VVTCPGSNANNGVGIMDLRTMLREGINVVLGNDSFGYDMLEEARSSHSFRISEQKSSVIFLQTYFSTVILLQNFWVRRSAG